MVASGVKRAIDDSDGMIREALSQRVATRPPPASRARAAGAAAAPARATATSTWG